MNEKSVTTASQIQFVFASQEPKSETMAQPEAPKKALQFASPYRLRAGDIIRLDGKPCPVIRVSDCAAVVEVERPAREFQTIFGKAVRIQPKPKLVRISSNSLVPILNRGNGGAA
jgi:hypothetical protein